MRAAALLIIASALLGSPAAIARPTNPAIAEAKQHFLAGTKAFDLTQYDDAIREFELAYKLAGDPVFLFNIAQAHRLAGHLDKAARFYRNYLRLSPQSPERADIEKRIAEIETAVRLQEKQPAAPPKGVSPPVETPPTAPAPAPVTPPPVETPPPATQTDTGPAPGRTLRIAGLATGIAGVALLAVGVGLGAVGLSARDEYAHPAQGTPYDPGLEQRANLWPWIALPIGAVGAAAVVAGVVVGLKGLREGRARVARVVPAPLVGPRLAGAAVSFSF
jgi:tetratricopeptide (TPR) repeat protein